MSNSWTSRFSSTMDECVHLIIALVISETYEAQRHELIAKYGNTMTTKAYNTVMTDYRSLISRI